MWQRLLTFPSHPRTTWVVPAAMVVAIFAISAAQVPTEFDDAQERESTSFLPGEAESTEALAASGPRTWWPSSLGRGDRDREAGSG